METPLWSIAENAGLEGAVIVNKVREKVSSDDRPKKILPARHTVEMKEQVESHITLLEKRLTAGIGAEELEIFSDVLKKMQENM